MSAVSTDSTTAVSTFNIALTEIQGDTNSPYLAEVLLDLSKSTLKAHQGGV